MNIGGPPGPTLDPLHANTAKDAKCQDDGATLPLVAIQDAFGPDTVTVKTGNAQAETGITNADGPTYTQAPAAGAHLSNTFVNLAGDAGLTITAQAVRSYVIGQCRGNQPYLGTPDGPAGGEVVGLRINGTPVPAEGEPDAGLTQVFDGLSPLAPIVRVTLNKSNETTDPVTGEVVFTREAVRIEALTAPGMPPVATVVLGSATVDRLGDVCATPPGVTPPGDGGTPTVEPPVLATGGNEPGSNGGGVPSGGGNGNGNGTNGPAGDHKPDNGRNASKCVRLRMWFDRHRNGRAHYDSGPKRIKSRRGTREVIRGELHNCKGQAIIRGKLDQVHLIGKRRGLFKTGLRTRDGGRFTLILPNNLTTRRVRLRYRPFIHGTAVAARKSVKIVIRRRR